MYRDIEKIIQHDSQKYITTEGGEDLSNQKLTNCETEYDQFCCSDFTNVVCLYIIDKMSALEKLYNLVKIFNMNDDNEKNCYCVLTDFIRKLTDIFFMAVVKKHQQKFP